MIRTGIVTEAYRCKRALFDRLEALTGAGLPLAGLQVQYAWNGRTAEREQVYGGGVRFTRASAGHDGARELWLETAVVGLYVRVTEPGAEVAETDQRCEEIAGVVEELLASDPQLPGNYSYVGITGGTGDYAHDDDAPVSVLAYQVSFQYYLD